MDRALWSGFLNSADRYPARPALRFENRVFSYQELREAIYRLAATIQAHHPSSGEPLTAVFGYRTPTAFVGVLSSLFAGNGYVPLNRTFPIERTSAMLERSECQSVIVDGSSLPQLAQVLPRISRSLIILLPDVSDVSELRSTWRQHTFLTSQDFDSASSWTQPATALDSIAYLLFTSGSTGIPKGVPVSQRNVRAFVDYMVERYQVTEEDRFSQMFDMTFDLSAFDMFVAWERGACICCPGQKVLINPSRFIQQQELTIWFSVPSTIAFMKQMGVLKAGQYPSLRLSLFCGESLPISSAKDWLSAAPNSIVENLYGPTELTIACTLYRWDPASSPARSELGIVPIGYPYPDMKVLVVDENLQEVHPGQEGELLMNGPQMAPGYWKDPQKTASAFVIPPGQTEIFYRTGDRVRKPHKDMPLTHLGRVDFQVKVMGHRVELGEVEAKVREFCKVDGVVAVGWPVTASGCGGVEVFIQAREINTEELRRNLAVGLPDYMVPRRFHVLESLPRNANNKFDRKAMLKMLQEGL
ncbi:MAG: AMP-binding protein [Terriglobales bacterium]|jgi:amino acid adenylation domain-containing protein